MAFSYCANKTSTWTHIQQMNMQTPLIFNTPIPHSNIIEVGKGTKIWILFLWTLLQKNEDVQYFENKNRGYSLTKEWHTSLPQYLLIFIFEPILFFYPIQFLVSPNFKGLISILCENLDNSFQSNQHVDNIAFLFVWICMLRLVQDHDAGKIGCSFQWCTMMYFHLTSTAKNN